MADLTPTFSTGHRDLDAWINQVVAELRRVSPGIVVGHASGSQGGLRAAEDVTSDTSGLPEMVNTGTDTLSDGHVFGIDEDGVVALAQSG